MPTTLWALAQITFAAPAMLWGALAAAGPILIHLALRARSQRVALPTVQFVIKTQQQTESWRRIKHLLLLLLRTLAILLLVAALARPTLRTAAFSTMTRGPVEAVFCLDDSASMGVRSQDETRFELARAIAAKLLRDRTRFPPNSRLALLTGSLPSGATRLSPDVEYIRQQVEQLEVADHDRGVGGMLDHAYALLEEGALETREIYVFGDLTQQAWRGVPVGVYASRKDVQVFCIDVGTETDTNVALLDPVLPDRTVPAGAAAQIAIGLRSGDAGGKASLEVVLDGDPRWRLGPLSLKHREIVQKTAELTNLPPGLHQGEIRLRPDDALSADNVRYFSLHVGPLPRIAVIGRPDSQVVTIVSAMMAPANLPAERSRVALTQRRVDELGGMADLADQVAVVLADAASVPPAAFARLAEYVATGGQLIVIPGPSLEAGGYADGEAVLAALPAEVITPAQAVHVAPLDDPHPLLAPFRAGSGLSLCEPAIRRYVRFDEPLGGGQVLARMEDGAAALIIRQIGRGRSVALAFSPVREWSDFAIDAGPMLVLLNGLIAETLPRVCLARNLRVGRLTRLGLSEAGGRQRDGGGTASKDGRLVTITSPTRRESWPVAVHPDDGSVQAVTDRSGHYLIRSEARPERGGLGYSVNTPAEESNLSRAPMTAIASRFPPGRVQRVQRLDELVLTGQPGAATHALTGWLALALLGLLLAESFLSNRFHRQPEEDQAGPGGGV